MVLKGNYSCLVLVWPTDTTSVRTLLQSTFLRIRKPIKPVTLAIDLETAKCFALVESIVRSKFVDKELNLLKLNSLPGVSRVSLMYAHLPQYVGRATQSAFGLLTRHEQYRSSSLNLRYKPRFPHLCGHRTISLWNLCPFCRMAKYLNVYLLNCYRLPIRNHMMSSPRLLRMK